MGLINSKPTNRLHPEFGRSKVQQLAGKFEYFKQIKDTVP